MNASLKKKIILNDLYMLTAPVRHVPVLAVSQARANDSVSSRRSGGARCHCRSSLPALVARDPLCLHLALGQSLSHLIRLRFHQVPKYVWEMLQVSLLTSGLGYIGIRKWLSQGQGGHKQIPQEKNVKNWKVEN